MGKKKERVPKRKRKARKIELCREMVKKRKLSSEQKILETPSPHLESFFERNPDTDLDYVELHNVSTAVPANEKNRFDMPASEAAVDADSIVISCADNYADKSPFKDTLSGNYVLSYNKEHLSNITDNRQCVTMNDELPFIVENISEPTVQMELPDMGHRIIDINHFTMELIKISQHKSLFECGLATMKLVSEHQVGFQSVFTFICSMCKYKNNIKSSLAEVNKDAVAGIMAAGCGHAQLKQFSAAVDLPIMSDYTYNKIQNDICDEWEETAWEEMRKAGEMEREEAVKEGKVTKDGIPVIDVIVDGCWSKRSYRTNYSALSGAAAIIGRRSGRVLYMSVKNKYCCICARAQKKKETPKEHVCYKNFDGASTAMESTIITEGFKQSVEMHGLIYGRFIADGDSSTYAKIIEARPYPGITVAKISCRNHLLRNHCNKLHQLTTDTRYNVVDRKNITQRKILAARKYICDAIDLHKESKNVDALYNDINASVSHAFDRHDICNRQLCNKMLPDPPNPFFSSLLWQKIKTLHSQLADKTNSLIEDVDSNVVERFNGVIAKLVGGKRINYSQKRSYQSRCSGAVISFNTGNLLSTVHRNVIGRSPKKSIKKYEQIINRKRIKTAARNSKRKKNRMLVPRTLNLDYGEIVDKPDLDDDTFKKAKITFVQNLTKTLEERKEIEKRTILQSESGEWLELRRNMLTASNFGTIVKRKQTNSCQNLVKNLLYKPNIDHVSSINHGKKYEKVALEQLSAMNNIEIEKCGLFIDDVHPFLGATPDGIAGDMLVEIKCPIKPYKIGIDKAIQEKKMHFYKINNKGDVIINKNSNWFMQIQGQLHICKKQKCLLGIWYGDNKIKTEIIDKDDKFWADVIEPKLLKFYYDCLLPELVDPRYIRNKPIRDPEYVVAHSKENTIPKLNTPCVSEIQNPSTSAFYNINNNAENTDDLDYDENDNVEDFNQVHENYNYLSFSDY